MSTSKKIVLLYSGGLDSFIMLKLAEHQYPDAEVKCIYYKHGAPSEEKELSLLPDYVDVRQIDWLNEKVRPVAKKSNPHVGAIYIPGRNLLFATAAACQELPDEIWLGALTDECNDLATDKNHKFLHHANRAIEYVLSPFKDNIEVKFPFVERNWNKTDCVQWALDVGISLAEIKKTVSCSFHDGTSACGNCFQCLKRRLVFASLGHDVFESYEDPFETMRDTMIALLKDSKTSNDPDTINMGRMIEKALTNGFIAG